MLRKKEYRDLEKFKKTAREQKRRYYGKTQNAKNRGQSWSWSEIERIMKRDKTDMELSIEIGRSVKSIQVMRSKVNKRLGDVR